MAITRGARTPASAHFRGMSHFRGTRDSCRMQHGAWCMQDEIEMDALIAMRRDIKPTAERCSHPAPLQQWTMHRCNSGRCTAATVNDAPLQQ